MATEPEVPRPIKQYAWVINVWHLVGQDAFELAPGHILRRATADERTTIRDVMQKIPGGFFPQGRTVWQIEWPLPPDGKTVPLADEEEWRYFVIEFERGEDDAFVRIQEAFDLAQLELEVGFTVVGHTVTYYPARFFHILTEMSPARANLFVDVSVAEIMALRSLREKLERHDHTVVDLKRFVAQLRSLKALPHQSPLRFLGYFGVLEGLLTHKVNPTDTIDSITRQVKRKVTLLDHRWSPRLDYSAFGDNESDKVWTAMYACRSRLAHGDLADFADRDLRVLRNQDQALALLIAAVKAIMRYALDEPQLLVDLRNC